MCKSVLIAYRHCAIAVDTIRFASVPIDSNKLWPIVLMAAAVVAVAAMKLVAAVIKQLLVEKTDMKPF